MVLLAVAGCVQQASGGGGSRPSEPTFTTSGALIGSGPHATVYVRTRGDARLYALIDHDGDQRVDEVRAVVGARDPELPEVVLDDVPRRAQHGWRYVRFGERRWLYLPFELEPSYSTCAISRVSSRHRGAKEPRA